ncbi:MAG TPA: nuclease [Edaphobacter sp.]
MTPLSRIAGALGLIFLGVAAAGSFAQQIGSVGLQDATVAGSLEVSNGRAVLVGASTVTARDHTAEIALERGGTVKVCSTSGLHLTAGKGTGSAPLLLAIDRGAVEVATQVTANDVVMTPDLRFAMRSEGTLDLRVRVARNGDTCVENRGAKAPVLGVTDQFGESAYEVQAGQHVLFEHASLKEVVDNEHEPCGCPAAPVVSVADAGVTGANAAAPGGQVAAQAAAEQHPFPAAESAGLAPVNTPPPAPAGAVHAQVSTTMSFGGESGTGSDGSGGGASGATTTVPPANSATAGNAASAAATQIPSTPATDNTSAGRAEAPPPPPTPPPSDLFHSLGRFFHRLFGGH